MSNRAEIISAFALVASVIGGSIALVNTIDERISQRNKQCDNVSDVNRKRLEPWLERNALCADILRSALRPGISAESRERAMDECAGPQPELVQVPDFCSE